MNGGRKEGHRQQLQPQQAGPTAAVPAVSRIRQPVFQKRSLKFATLTWIIDDFRRRREKQGVPIISDLFSSQDSENEGTTPGTQFKVYFFPNGNEDPDFTSLFLLINSKTSDSDCMTRPSSQSRDPVKARFAVSILDKNNELKVRKVFPDIVRPGMRDGWSKFFPRRKILDAMSQILRNGHVTLVIDVHYLDQEVADDHINAIFSLSPLFAPKSKTGSEDFKALFESKNYDICLKLRDRSIPIHRIVLCSSSSLIEKSLLRDRRTFFAIEDFDPRTVTQAAYFMYHRTFESTEPDYSDLLRFAHKYEVPSLQFACETELYQTANVDNLIPRLKLAHECRSSLLSEVLKFLIIENVEAVTRTRGWRDALTHDHELVTHIVQLLGQQLSRRH